MDARYWVYEALWNQLRVWERQYPEYFSVEVAGHSRAGRDLALCVLTDRRTGAPSSKPGSFVDANIHAGEVAGNAVAMFWMGTLLEESRDPSSEASRLLREHTLYVVPRIAMDGAEAYLTTPMRLRSSPHWYPLSPADSGMVPDDVNGDGLILTMRQQSPDGGFKVDSEDPRLMVRRQPDDGPEAGPFYHLYTEGRWEQRAEMGVRPLTPLLRPQRRMAMDFNRNFPIRWAGEQGQPGAGPYPLSEPETRAVADAVLGHGNIATYVALHTSGGVILRQPSLGDDTGLNLQDLGYYRDVGEMGERRSGYFCRSNYQAFATGHEKAGLMPGAADDWAYDTQGILGFTLEIWDLERHADARGYAEHGVRKLMGLSAQEAYEDSRKVLRWVSETLGDEAFHPWTPFEHPELGPVEIGGLEPKFLVQNPPELLLHQECVNVSRFLSGLALASPRLTVGGYVVESLGQDRYRVAVEVANGGYLPTSATAKGRELSGVSPVRASLSGASVTAGLSPMSLGHLDGYGAASHGAPAHQTAVAEWVVCGPSHAVVEVVFDGGRAGVARIQLALEPASRGLLTPAAGSSPSASPVL